MPWMPYYGSLNGPGCLMPSRPITFYFRSRSAAEWDTIPRNLRKGGAAWRKLTKAAGLSGLRFHDLRHTFITGHAEIETPLSVVMAQVGHLSARMTKEYTHISQRAKQEA